FTEATAERMKMPENTKHRLQDALIAEQNRQKFDLQPHTILKWPESFTGKLSDPNNRKEVMEDYPERTRSFPISWLRHSSTLKKKPVCSLVRLQ
ncbi:MAG: hypothetical protein K6E42_01035, partial [Synergistes sp.]|nr:hypothetical protein [Synergistes sp.]